MLTPIVEAEISTLAARYGAPRRVVAELEAGTIRPLTSRDRIGEVCMVVRRKNGKLLTAIKTFYPSGAFRLLTGGVNHSESIEAALLRETYEETGLDVVVRQFLGVIEYRVRSQGPGTRNQGPGTKVAAETLTPSMLSFATFAFLLDEIGGILGVQDEHEQLGAFREVAVDELPEIADVLDHVGDGFHPEIEGSWRDWGHFRAVVHRVVYDAMIE